MASVGSGDILERSGRLRLLSLSAPCLTGLLSSIPTAATGRDLYIDLGYLLTCLRLLVGWQSGAALVLGGACLPSFFTFMHHFIVRI